jgi:hypothetical protein
VELIVFDYSVSSSTLPGEKKREKKQKKQKRPEDCFCAVFRPIPVILPINVGKF